MEKLELREAVNRISLTVGAGFAGVVYALDMMGAEVGVGIAIPLSVPALYATYDAHRRSKEGDNPDGVREVATE